MIAVAFRLGESRSCVHCPHYPIHPRSQRLRSSCRGSSTLSFRLSFNFSTFPHAKTNDFFGLGGCCCAAPLGLCRCRHRQWAGWRSIKARVGRVGAAAAAGALRVAASGAAPASSG